MKNLFGKSEFWSGIITGIGIVLLTMLVCSRVSKEEISDTSNEHIIFVFEKIGDRHYVFDVDTLTDEVIRIHRYIQYEDDESWERKQSIKGRE